MGKQKKCVPRKSHVQFDNMESSCKSCHDKQRNAPTENEGNSATRIVDKTSAESTPKLRTLEEAYSEATPEDIKANKLLPRPCYGNSNGYYCNYTCSDKAGCYAITMVNWGPCDCPFKPSCHLGRQQIQVQWLREKPAHVCSFKKYFDTTTYPQLPIIPKGVMRMRILTDYKKDGGNTND